MAIQTTTPSRVVADEVLAQLARRRMTRAALAAASGIPERTLHRRLNGDSNHPWTLDELSAVAGVLGTSVAALTQPLSTARETAAVR